MQPDFKAIKKRIEDLISRDYLERDKENPNLYRYVAWLNLVDVQVRDRKIYTPWGTSLEYIPKPSEHTKKLDSLSGFYFLSFFLLVICIFIRKKGHF